MAAFVDIEFNAWLNSSGIDKGVKEANNALMGLAKNIGKGLPDEAIAPTIKPKVDVSALTNAASNLRGAFSTIMSGNITGAVSELGTALTGVTTAAGAAGVALGAIAIAVAAIVAVVAIVKTSIDAFRDWAGQIENVKLLLGLTAEEASSLAVAARLVGMDVGEMGASFSYLVRALNNAKVGVDKAETQIVEMTQTAATQVAQIWSDAGDRTKEIQVSLAESIQTIQSNLNDTRITISQDLADRVEEIEATLADRITSINESLAERVSGIRESLAQQLSDFNDQRKKNEEDLARSLAKLDEHWLEDRKKLHGRARREAKKAYEENRAEMIRAANEQKAQIDKQEARAVETANREIQVAERSAAKQIEAAEKVAAKQIAASEKAAAKQEAAADRTAAKQILAAQKVADKQIEAAEKAAAKQAALIDKALQKDVAKTRAAALTDPILRGLEKLGISADEAFKLMDKPFELITLIADKYAKLPEGMERTKTLFDIFGRSGAKLGEMFEKGGDFIRNYAGEFAILNGLMESETTLNAYKKNEIAINGLGLAVDGLRVQIGRLAEAQMQLNDKGQIDTWKQLKTVLDQAGESLKLLSMSFFLMAVTITAKAAETVATLGGIKDLLVKFFVGEINTAFNSLATNVSAAWTGIQTTIQTVWNNIIATFSNAYTAAYTLGQNVKNGLQTGLTGIGLPEIKITPTGVTSGGGGGGGGFGGGNSFASGGFVPRNMVAMLHAGEYVLNKRQVDSANKGGGINLTIAPVFNVPIDSSNARSIVQQIKDVVHQEMTTVLGAA